MTLAVGGDVTRLPCWCVANGFFVHSFSATTKRLTRSAFVRSHTCSFQLDLPEYPTAAELQHKLRRALEEQAFGLA